MSNVADFPTTTRKPLRKSRAVPMGHSLSHRRKIARQRVASYGVGAVALALTALSLSHLATGIQRLTGCDTISAWAMASGIDLAFISLELAMISIVTESLRRQVARFAVPAVNGTLLVSASTNAFVFAALATTWPFMAAASLLGISIPALIYVLTRVSVSMWIDCHR
jgi:hypothetical protein